MAAAPDRIAVLDIGKTNAKLLLVDGATGETVWRCERPCSTVRGPLVRELDVRGIAEWLLSNLTRAPDKQHIRALVPVAHGAAAVLVGKDGQVLVAPEYEDPAFESLDQTYRRLRDDFASTLSPLLPFGLNLGRQLHYLQSHEPSLFRADTRILLYPQYWAWLLSGVMASELTSLGSHTDLWRPLARGFSSLVAKCNWTACFPELRAAGDVLGMLRPEIAARTGLNPSTKVLCGIHDSNASYLCHLASRPAQESFAIVSSGTWTVVMARHADLARLRESRDMLANVDARGSPVATARFMGGREYASIAGPSLSDNPPGTHPTMAGLQDVLQRGAFARPCFARTGGPFAHCNGTLVNAEGLSAESRAALATLYCALMTDLLLDSLGTNGDVEVDGPFADNTLFCQVLATLRPRDRVRAADKRIGPALGAAILAGIPTTSEPRLPVRPLAQPALAEYRRSWREQLPNLAD